MKEKDDLDVFDKDYECQGQLTLDMFLSIPQEVSGWLEGSMNPPIEDMDE